MHTLVQDKTYPTMWRVQYPDGTLSDMYNLSRAVALLRRLENNK